MPPEISVLIPTLGRNAKLEVALDRLERQTIPPQRFEVIVVADAAENDVAAVDRVVSERSFKIQRLQAQRPGASAARNVAWRAAAAPLLLFLDDDVHPEPQLLAEHLSWQERHPQPEVGVLGRVRWADNLKVTPFMRWLDDGIQFDFQNIEGTEAGWGRLVTANVSLKREMVARVDGFDEERLPFGYEDLDLAYRMKERGFRLLYNRNAIAEHQHAMDLQLWIGRMERIARAERRFCELHPDVPPYFHRLLANAAEAAPAKGRGERLAAVVPSWVPGLGPWVWKSADAVYRQALAEPFFRAWNRSAPDGREPAGELRPAPVSQ